LLLISAAKNVIPEYSKPEWDEAARLGVERIWKEGLLSKGGGVCHGHAGNAWPLLLLHILCEYCAKNGIKDASPETDASGRSGRITRSVTKMRHLTGDNLLSMALALLLYARKTQPFSENAEA
jgi:hypothetical protein